MGRTVKPVRWEVESQLQELRRYIHSLRREDKEHFESLYASVKSHISSISYANPLNPVELMQWSVIIELDKKLAKLKDEIDRCVCGRG